MVLIDANVILRYLLNDNSAQYEVANHLIEMGCCTTSEVLAEVVYVLMKVYKVARADAAAALFSLLKKVEIENGIAVIYATKLFMESSLDFVDCLLIAYNNVLNQKVFSFDKKLNSHLNQI